MKSKTQKKPKKNQKPKSHIPITPKHTQESALEITPKDSQEAALEQLIFFADNPQHIDEILLNSTKLIDNWLQKNTNNHDDDDIPELGFSIDVVGDTANDDVIQNQDNVLDIVKK